MTRPDWDQTWSTVASIIGARSRCHLRRVGAVIVSADNSYVCVGYNGPPAGFATLTDSDCRSWCPRAVTGLQTRDYDNCVAVHAETNAIAKADRSRILGGTIYIASSVCWECGKVVANSGLSTVVMQLDAERDAHRLPQRTIDFLEQCGLDVVVL